MPDVKEGRVAEGDERRSRRSRAGDDMDPEDVRDGASDWVQQSAGQREL